VKLLFSWKALLTDFGSCLRIKHLKELTAENAYDYLAFCQWDEVIDNMTAECAREKKSKKLEFQRLNQRFLFQIEYIENDDNFNFKSDIYELA